MARATLHGEGEARTALEELCRRYWAPLKSFIRLRGYSEVESEDLTQEFLLHLLERSALRKPDAARGRFRSFLLGALSNFLSHERERRLAQKRRQHLSLEALANGQAAEPMIVSEHESVEFDREWALTIVRSALASVGGDYARSWRAALLNLLRHYLPSEGTQPFKGEIVRFLDGFLPKQGNSVHFLSVGGAVSGAFAEITFPQLAPGFEVDLTQSNVGLRLIARNDATVAEPVLRFTQVSWNAGQMALTWTTTPGAGLSRGSNG